MKRIWCCAVLALVALGYQTIAESGDDEAGQSSMPNDFENIADGTYSGSHRSGLVSSTVELTVVDHAITAFTIKKHRCGRGRPAEAVAERVVERQTLAVDVVSGASTSSRVILKAAEKALAKAKAGK